MTIKKFPSQEFPQLPSVEIDVQEGWESQSLPNSVIALTKEDSSSFFSNVLIDIKKVEKSYDFASNTAELQKYIQNFEKLNIFSNSLYEINDQQWKVEEFAYINQNIGALAQLVAISFIMSNDTKFMISVTGRLSFKKKKRKIKIMKKSKKC
ncbi:hypothetical protein [Lactococcus protaetiae]|uniref:DUF1795 domain-containing protein n=1 Tax=Lactococcus protaetiae TaxID=2592653 RepID=A0A514Z9Y3_9LACT|nr:hypothetical protein [Lactococcus protaetiae]QDK71375.1 hypothetical protein FLP15_09680 [Lactococcus protaetiae]